MEVALLVMAYTVIVITLFLEIVCYKRNIETLETIALTASLLLLIIALTFTFFNNQQNEAEQTNVFTLLAMTLVGLTTSLNVLNERKHTISPLVQKLLFYVSGALGVTVLVGYVVDSLNTIQYIVAAFLGLSVISSMILIKTTKPHVRIEHREKLDQYTAIAFLVIVPITLIIDYSAQQPTSSVQYAGYTIPILFILLGGSKLWDDIHRLSLFKSKEAGTIQDLDNYALTNREKEVTLLLLEGHSYKQIADKLFISIPTVKTHVSKVYKKCKVTGRLELIKLLG